MEQDAKKIMLPLFKPAQKTDSNWEGLKEETIACNRCSLRKGCTQVVFGVGQQKNPLMLVGEGPGAQEDKEGEPFVGRAGQLLDRILYAINLERNQVYISNIVKCRPPGNRQPTVEEMATCMIWLKREISIIKPEIIVLLGATALRGLIGPQGRITKVRGQWIKKEGISYMPTYHPAALLRDPGKKKPVWQDFQNVQKMLAK